MKNRFYKNFQMLMLLGVLTFAGVFSVQAREKEPDENDLSLFMDESIYEAQEHFHCDAPVPARGFSLFMQLGELNEDGTAEAGMTAYSDTGIVRSVQINKTDKEYNIFEIHCGDYLCDATETLLDCHYTLKSSEKGADGSFTDTYNSYMDLYTLYLTTDADTKVTNIFLMKNN